MPKTRQATQLTACRGEIVLQGSGTLHGRTIGVFSPRSTQWATDQS
jgi:hypothetical protein